MRKSRAGPKQPPSDQKNTVKKPPLKSTQRGPIPADFPIAGIGSSAGGLEALKKLFSLLPKDTGIGYVVIQHLDPTHQSMTSEILSRETAMPVTEIEDGMEVEKNHVYVIPPDQNVEISGRILKLISRHPERGINLPFDFFLTSLANSKSLRAIAIVLSGTGSDGSMGLQPIKSQGGLTIAQAPNTAKYDSMPQCAIDTGSVALILTPEEIAAELTNQSSPWWAGLKSKSKTQEPLKSADYPAEHPPETIFPRDEGLTSVLAFLRHGTGVDFSHYKQNSLQRRISRRMLVHNAKNYSRYAQYLENHPDEIKALFDEILIHVTGFFRDPGVFDALKSHLKEKFSKKQDINVPFRIWVPGCSTGEETYSLAIACCEIQELGGSARPIIIFGSDLSEASLRVARAGVYDESLAKKVLSKDRLQKYFERTASGKLKVAKRIREMCLFSRHDVTKDPPFANLDLISCRNLLIYFDTKLQQTVVPIFHYALKQDGILVLGKSETIGNFGSLFKTKENIHKIYFKKKCSLPLRLPFVTKPYPADALPTLRQTNELFPSRTDLMRLADRMAIDLYVPACVLVTESLEIIHSRGKTSPYLELPSGQPTLNILRMAHPEIVADLRALLTEVRKKAKPQTLTSLAIHEESRARHFSIKVVPISTHQPASEMYYSIFFQEDPFEKGKKIVPPKKTKNLDQNSRHLELQKELSANHAYQASLIEDYQASQEELVSSNEELQSINEELQSTNEELETAKEELQSTNEELSTVNDQMQTRNAEIASLNLDFKNLFEGSSIPIVMLNPKGHIRLYTPKASDTLNLGPSDIGKQLDQVQAMTSMPQLDQMLSDVLGHRKFKELEIQDHRGHWYNLQARPSLTDNDESTGAVLSLLDIDKIKRAREDATAIIDALPIPLLVIDKNQVVKIANQIFCDKFKVIRAETEGQLVSELGEGQWNIPKLLNRLSENFTKNVSFDNFEVETYIPNLGRKSHLLHGRRIQLSGTNEPATLLVIVDISDIRQTEMALLESEKNRQLIDINKKLSEESAVQEKVLRENAEKANLLKDEFLAILSHELRTPLSAIYSWAQQLMSGNLDSEKTLYGIKVIYQSAKVQCQLVDDLLDISRIQAGKLNLSFQDTDVRKAIAVAIESTQTLAVNKKITIKTLVNPNVGLIYADPVRLEQILWNLITNGIKFSPMGSQIVVKLDQVTSPTGDQLSLQVIDKGKGIDKEFLPIIFDRFTQVDSSSTRSYGGLGLGLAIAKKLVEMHQGTITAESEGEGKGSTFRVLLPLTQPSHKLEEGQTTMDKKTLPTLETSLQGVKVLVVDDDSFSREIFSITIESFGAVVHAVESAQAGFDALREFSPDILISDISMPGEDGFSFIKRVRALPPPLGHIPAIALTAHAGREDIEKTLKTGFQAHLVKPVDGNKLALLIASLVTRN